MKLMALLTLSLVFISCNVVQMITSAKTKVPSDFYAHAAVTSVPPIMLGSGIFPQASGANCVGTDYPSAQKIKGAGFSDTTALIVYATKASGASTETPITEIKILPSQFIDQGEVVYDLTVLPDIPQYDRFIFKLENESGAFSKGNSYYIECSM